MFNIDKRNKMKLTKGDTASFAIDVSDLDGLEYTAADGDVITFTVKKPGVATTVLQKTATDGQITISSSDTSNITPGTYIYDIQLSNSTEGYVYTIVPNANDGVAIFELVQEVTL